MDLAERLIFRFRAKNTIRSKFVVHFQKFPSLFATAEPDFKIGNAVPQFFSRINICHTSSASDLSREPGNKPRCPFCDSSSELRNLQN
jgi:hypothetical protein